MTAATESTTKGPRGRVSAACSCGDNCAGPITVDEARIDAMNDDFETVAGERPNGFMCPLCAREVDRGCVSDAHAPSRRLGGSKVTLTCRCCNSTMGTWYEADAVDVLGSRIARKSGKVTERIRAASGDPTDNLVGVNITYEFKGDGSIDRVSIRPPDGKSASAYWSKQVHKIAATPGSTVRLEGRPISVQAVPRALLYWAFLKLTAEVGYRFAGAPGSRVVADALLDQSSTVLGQAFKLQVPPAPAVPSELEPSEPFLWASPTGMQDLECLGWRFGDFLVMLPWPSDATGDIYRRFDDRAARGLTNFGGGKVPTPSLLRKVYAEAPKPAAT